MKAILVYPSESCAGNFLWAQQYIYPLMDLNESIEKLRNKGYWISKFPEGDGLAFTHETKSDNNQIYCDFKNAFKWIKVLPQTIQEGIEFEQLINEQIVLMPLTRFMIYEPILTENYCIFPKGYINTKDLNPSSIDLEFYGNSDNKSLRDHITEITGFKYEKINEYPLIVFRNNISFEKYINQNQIDDFEMIKEFSECADEFLDIIRFYNCEYTVPEGLPSKAGIWGNRYSVALIYFPKYDKTFFQSREVEVKNYVRGVGIELLNKEVIENHPLLKSEIGETGNIVKNGLRMNSEILENDNETMKFVNIFTLFDFLGDPYQFKKFQDIKKNIIRSIVKEKKEYHDLSNRFRELTKGTDEFDGLRTAIVHLGKNLVELIPNYEKRRELFKELEKYLKEKISDMLNHSNASWEEYEDILEKRYQEMIK